VPGSRWGSFVADAEAAHIIHEAGNPAHRCRVEHDATTLLVHLSGEDGDGWTALAVDRATRHWAVGQARTQLAAATRAVDLLRGRSAEDQPE
jgi:hypothetical protein